MKGLCLAGMLALFGWFRSGADLYFARWHADSPALAPDGRHMAFLEESGSTHVEVVIVDCAAPDLRSTTQLALLQPSPGPGLGALAWLDQTHCEVDLPDRTHWLITAGSDQAVALGSAGSGLPPAPLEPAESAIAAKFLERSVTVASWDRTRQRAVLWVHSPAEAGRYFLYDRPTERLTEFDRRLPSLHWADLADVQSFQLPGDRPRTAVYSAPHIRGTHKLPLVLLDRGVEVRPDALEYEPFTQSLCAAGFAVLEVSSAPDEWHTEREQAQLRALALAFVQFPVDRTRVAVLGVGPGGKWAQRLAGQHPEIFRCGVALGTGSTADASEADAGRFFTVPKKYGERAAAATTALSYLRQRL